MTKPSEVPLERPPTLDSDATLLSDPSAPEQLPQEESAETLSKVDLSYDDDRGEEADEGEERETDGEKEQPATDLPKDMEVPALAVSPARSHGNEELHRRDAVAEPELEEEDESATLEELPNPWVDRLLDYRWCGGVSDYADPLRLFCCQRLVLSREPDGGASNPTPAKSRPGIAN